jgi:hypothetical protein
MLRRHYPATQLAVQTRYITNQHLCAYNREQTKARIMESPMQSANSVISQKNEYSSYPDAISAAAR